MFIVLLEFSDNQAQAGQHGAGHRLRLRAPSKADERLRFLLGQAP